MKIKIFKFSLLIFLALVFFCPKPTYALTSLWTYFLVTNDTTPDLKGEVDDAAAVVTVTIDAVDYVATNNGDGTWHLQMGAMALGAYDFSVRAEKGGEATITNDLTNGLVIASASSPHEYYAKGTDSEHLEFLDFSIDESFAVSSNFTVTFQANTRATKTGGGTFSLGDWIIAEMTSNSDKVIRAIKFGITETDISFSKNVSVVSNVGSSYNGETLNIFSREETESDWDKRTTCTVSGGNCTFSVSHASYFVISDEDNLNSLHKGGLIYKKYKDHKKDYKNKKDKQRYFTVRQIRRENKALFWKMRDIYQKHKTDSEEVFNKLDQGTKDLFKLYEGYHGHKQYKGFKEKVFNDSSLDFQLNLIIV